ncbi:MAG: hypothetical protein M3Y56_00270, partial [Armatimonadota bacterium]|nr:hypothetical protein [Armatimonadota bacterium]
RTAAHILSQNVAIPSAWPTGYAHGLLARGGFEMDIDWTDGHFTQALVHSHLGGLCRVRYGEDVVTLETKPGRKYRVDNGLGVVGE